jgi:hypothetical protein
MPHDQDSDKIAELAAEAVAPIEQELRARLALELSDSGLLAIETALLKAFINGMRTAAGEATELAVDLDQTGFSATFGGLRTRSAAQLDPELPWLDPWADKYGAHG